MALRLIRCACGHPAMLETSAINRAARQGAPIYCTRECAGLARRLKSPPTDAERRAAKRLYDIGYRARNAVERKVQKAAYFRRTYDPQKAAVERKARMPRHIEYCQRPEYVAWKADYDRKYRAKQDFGEFWEPALALLDLEKEVSSRITRYEIYQQNGTLNKKLNRRRDYDKTLGR